MPVGPVASPTKKNHCCPEVGIGGTIVYSREFDFDSCPIACVVGKFHLTNGQKTRDQITSDRRSKRA